LKTESYSVLQISFILIQSIGLLNHVLVIPMLLDASGRDSWLSAIATFAVLIPFLLIVARVTRRLNRRPLMDYVTSGYGGAFARALAYAFALLLLVSAAVTCKDLTIWTTSSYLPLTPPSVIASTFVALAAFSAGVGLRSIAFSAAILLPFIVLFGEFVMVANLPHKDYGLLFPLFENGRWDWLRGIPYAGSGLTELLFLVFLQHKVSSRIRRRHLLLLGFLLAGLTIGPLMGGISEFGPHESALQRYPAFEEWRLVKIGSFIEHVDFLSIFQWVCGAFIRLSFTLWLIGQLFARKSALILSSAAVFLLVVYPVGDIAFVNWLIRYYLPIDFYAMLGLSLLLLLLVSLPRIPSAKESAP